MAGFTFPKVYNTYFLAIVSTIGKSTVLLKIVGYTRIT